MIPHNYKRNRGYDCQVLKTPCNVIQRDYKRSRNGKSQACKELQFQYYNEMDFFPHNLSLSVKGIILKIDSNTYHFTIYIIYFIVIDWLFVMYFMPYQKCIDDNESLYALQK